MAASAYHSASGYIKVWEPYKIYVEERLCDSSEHTGRLITCGGFESIWISATFILQMRKTQGKDSVLRNCKILTR